MLGVVCTLGLGSPARSEDAASAPVPAAGMRAYVDPRTGALVPAPVPGAPPAAPGFSRSAAGLVETRAPGGGVMVNLQGRFQSPLVATVGPDGRVRLQHLRPAE
jgi:hypothetical protein